MGKVLTLDQLKRRRRTLANRRCFLCEEEETVGHLLIHFPKARLLWDLFFAIVGISCVFIRMVRETLLSWHDYFVGKRHKKAWMIAPLCILWTIFRERNKIAFFLIFRFIG